LATRYFGFLAYQRSPPAIQQYPIFAAIVRIRRRRFQRSAAHQREIIRMNPRQRAIQIVEGRVGRDAKQLTEIVGANAAIAAQVEIEGGDTGRGLSDIQ